LDTYNQSKKFLRVLLILILTLIKEQLKGIGLNAGVFTENTMIVSYEIVFNGRSSSISRCSQYKRTITIYKIYAREAL